MRRALVLLVLAGSLAAGCGGNSGTSAMVAKAKQRFAEAQARGVDMSSGPCLGTIAPGWVVDIAHSPRLPVDNLPQNQCAAYRAGGAKHFVELDPRGKLIRAN